MAQKDTSGRLRAKFVPVTTGITGTTDIEVLSGLKPGDEIVTGPYKILRDLKDGSLLKRDTSMTALSVTPAFADRNSQRLTERILAQHLYNAIKGSG